MVGEWKISLTTNRLDFLPIGRSVIKAVPLQAEPGSRPQTNNRLYPELAEGNQQPLLNCKNNHDT